MKSGNKKNVQTQTETSETTITNKIYKIEESNDDTIEEVDISVKENVKSKKLLAQNSKEFWETIKIPNLRIQG